MQNKYQKNDWLLLIGFFLILISLCVFLSYYILYNINSCTTDPLKYATNKIKENTDADYITGSISIFKEGTKGEIVYFGERNKSETFSMFENITLENISF